MSDTAQSSGAQPANRTNYRWIILVVVCLGQMINWMDRSTIGVVLPVLRTEFSMSNFEAGTLASIFFLGYACVQIPAGFLVSRFGLRRVVTASTLAFSAVTYLIGTATSLFGIRLGRLALGITEAPTPVGTNSTIKNWFPLRERGIAAGFLNAATAAATMITAPVAVWIMIHQGWRSVFFWFAIPGFFVAIIWYLVVRIRPEPSKYCSEAEVEYILGTATSGPAAPKKTVGSLGWLDKVIRLKKCDLIETNIKIFTSRNTIGIAVAYFFTLGINNGLLTWLPSYLMNARGFTATEMGWVTALPWLGGLLGPLVGGVVSDKLLLGRRKPMILAATIIQTLILWTITSVGNNVIVFSVLLFVVGFFQYIAVPAFFIYPMGLTTNKTYPVAASLLITGGNVGAFFTPMMSGYLLDVYKSYDSVFIFLGLCAFLSFAIVSMLDEPAVV